MAKGTARIVNKRLTPQDKSRHEIIRKQIEQEKPELIARGRAAKQKHARLKQAVSTLKAARVEQGLSLADVGQRAGIEKGNLSRLENAQHPNPTVDTLTRYANAVGKDIVITLVDQSV